MIEIDPEFRQILIRVVGIGSAIMIVGGTGLFFAFRAFAPSQKPGRDFRAVVIIIAVLVVVMAGCLLLLLLSFAKR